ncbi:MAG TPA: NAD(P)H-dependent oxidoreductase subunit E [Syntrophales bacterium]|nr:NAD(P)H-dependent oxidoreductase subunit E [Syntrophales bacterium]
MSDLNAILEGRRSQPHQLVEVLQDVQGLYGYISHDAMNIVSKELGVPLMEVFRVANFYKAFSLTPRGKNVITVCTGTACHVRGANLLIDQIRGQLNIEPGKTTQDGQFTVECVNCIGACALGPVVVQNGACGHHATPGKLRKWINEACKTKKEEIPHGKAQAHR